LIVNFAVMAAIVGPGRSHHLYLALRKSGWDDFIIPSLQIWIVGSTLAATALFVAVVRRRAKLDPSYTCPRLNFEATLLAAWWCTLFGLMAYAFMQGIGG
jgi:hypothetical protein